MSQNKTKVAGLDSSEAGNYGGYNMGGGSPDPSFYARTGNEPKRGTVITGLGGNEEPTKGQASTQPQQGSAYVGSAGKSNNAAFGKPVVGFLYSISRTGVGEYWPIHIGQNTIGKSATCDIILPEATVSSDHAVLVARKLKKPEKVIASLCDSRSTNGTMLNGESLGFNPVECKNGDIITVGDNYELILILIDAATIGLHVSENFIPVEVSEPETGGNMPPMFDPQGTNPGGLSNGGYNPGSFNPGNPDNFNPPSFNPSGTVGLDGSGVGGHGGTVGM